MSFFWKGRLGEKPSDLLKHLGRSSPSLPVTASRIAFRDLLIRIIMSSSLDIREKLIEVSERHVEPCNVRTSYEYDTI